MKYKNLEDRLALIAAVIVLVGVTTAAEDALADDFTPARLEVQNGGTISMLVAGSE